MTDDGWGRERGTKKGSVTTGHGVERIGRGMLMVGSVGAGGEGGEIDGEKTPPRGRPRGGHKGLDRRDKASLSARRSSPLYGSVLPMANICRKRASRPARREARAGRDGNMAGSRMPRSPPRSATEEVGAWINVRAGGHGGGAVGRGGRRRAVPPSAAPRFIGPPPAGPPLLLSRPSPRLCGDPLPYGARPTP